MSLTRTIEKLLAYNVLIGEKAYEALKEEVIRVGGWRVVLKHPELSPSLKVAATTRAFLATAWKNQVEITDFRDMVSMIIDCGFDDEEAEAAVSTFSKNVISHSRDIPFILEMMNFLGNELEMVDLAKGIAKNSLFRHYLDYSKKSVSGEVLRPVLKFFSSRIRDALEGELLAKTERSFLKRMILTEDSDVFRNVIVAGKELSFIEYTSVSDLEEMMKCQQVSARKKVNVVEMFRARPRIVTSGKKNKYAYSMPTFLAEASVKKIIWDLAIDCAANASVIKASIETVASRAACVMMPLCDFDLSRQWPHSCAGLMSDPNRQKSEVLSVIDTCFSKEELFRILNVFTYKIRPKSSTQIKDAVLSIMRYLDWCENAIGWLTFEEFIEHSKVLSESLAPKLLTEDDLKKYNLSK